ncbi:Ig-like domain-containing protein [Flavobacterium cerinum]|uniref:Ig-like domain-containing protein n=1 Tax=Flavobacterium cerinum TaxID=2502784 RepID=A0ABY5IUW8_9FLAO|nr:Ig-like domain-containing protein [Flavobacterium cerinum]UUC46100.1 Ig-like domain-containing protein [Flavobacterium cerinum]
MLKYRIAFLIVVFSVLLTGCAKRGMVSGGPKDTIPPTITYSVPKNFSTNFNGNLIKINFDEYIKVKDINKQLIISPPMKKAPDIVPMGYASKYITIKIKDTLLPNTTYSFNFGQSIADNNEMNPYSQFKYVFSTGDYIDSLKIGGMIRDAYHKKVDNFVSVMLYEAETFADSTVFKQHPRYVTNTLDSLKIFTLENLKEGKYFLVALKDANNDYKFNPKTDKIAFFKNPIQVPNDTIFRLDLFKEEVDFKAEKPTQENPNRLILGFEGKEKAKNTKIVVSKGNEILNTTITKYSTKDSLNIWLPKIKADSLKIQVTNGEYTKEFITKIKEMKAKNDTLSFEAKPTGNINFRDTFTITPSIPLSKIDQAKIKLTSSKDSTAVPFRINYLEYEKKLEIDFKKDPNQRYSLTLFPGALTDFYQAKNDTLKYTLATRQNTDFGNLRVRLENVKRFPVILELLDKDGKILASEYSEKETTIDYNLLDPNAYTLRLIYDDNKNRKWDTGNFLRREQPEEVIYFQGEVDVRANWDVDQVFKLD